MGLTSPEGRRGQSSTIGVVLLFGLIITGAGLVVVAGTAAITDTQATSDVERASQELTLFDSRAAMVALGDAESQSVRLSNGDYTVNDSAGRMIVEITNETSNNTEVIYNGTIGTFLYQNDDVEIAYQGGGVWRRDENGGATMVSPPEFHFRRATLTLPIINVINSDSAGGSVNARVKSKGKLGRFYPNESASYSNMTGEPYLNPIKAKNWTGTVRVESRYARGWYKYFLERTGGNATLIDDNTAQVELKTLSGDIGPFPMPNEGNALEVTGVASGSSHAINTFSLNITSESTNSKDFVELPWSMYIDRGNVEFELRISGDHNCKPSPGTFPYQYPSGDIIVDIYYRNETASPTVHEEWTGRVDSADFIEAKCVGNKKAFANIQLVPSSNTTLEYKDITINGNSKMEFESTITSNSPTTGLPTSFDAHVDDTPSGPYSIGTTKDMDFVVDHYLTLLGPNYDMVVRDGPAASSRVDEGASGGVLTYDTVGGDEFLTYLHITENNVTVDVGG